MKKLLIFSVVISMTFFALFMLNYDYKYYMAEQLEFISHIEKEIAETDKLPSGIGKSIISDDLYDNIQIVYGKYDGTIVFLIPHKFSKYIFELKKVIRDVRKKHKKYQKYLILIGVSECTFDCSLPEVPEE